MPADWGTFVIDAPGTGIVSEVVAHIERFLAYSIEGRRESSATTLAELRPVMRGRRLLSCLEAIGAGALQVSMARDGLFVAGDTDGKIAVAAGFAMDALARRVRCRRPLVILLASGLEPHANLVQEVDGVALVLMSQVEGLDRATLLHELAHSLSLADHRILDEGWSEWLEASVTTNDLIDFDSLRLLASGAPSASTLLSRRWREQACFESFGYDTTIAIRAACTLIVAELIGRIGDNEFISLMAAVRDCGTEDCRSLIEAVAGPCETSWNTSVDDLAQSVDHDEVRRAFTLGQLELALDQSSRVRLAYANAPDDTQLAVSNLMVILLSASRLDAAESRRAAERELRVFVDRHGDVAISYALCASFAGIEVMHATSHLATAESFSRGRAIITDALRRFPEDLDVLIAAAKFELNTPNEYGGDSRFATELLLRAASAAPWPDVSEHLKGVAASRLAAGTPR